MKLGYVTARFPYADEEQFFEPEVRALARHHDVLLIPTRPRHFEERFAGSNASALPLALISPRVIRLAWREFARAPGRVLAVLASVVREGATVQARAANLAVFPKALAVAHEARRHGLEHIHATWLTAPATIAYVVWRCTGIPYSMTGHQHDIFYQNMLPEKVRHARFVRVISERNCGHLRERLGPLEAARCTVAHLGVVLPPATPVPSDREPRILCAARLCVWKGHRYLLEALAALRDRGYAFTCDLAGGGELEREIASHIVRLGLGDRVRMLGNVPHARLTESLARGDYDLFALASTERAGEHEGIPVAAMEAMAAGLPVVATRTGSLDELVDSASGTLVPQRDALALAAALEGFLAAPDARRRAGRFARARILAEFESEATTRRLLALLGVPRPKQHSVTAAAG